MDTELERRAERVFEQTLDAPTEDRPAAIAAACGGDAELLARVQALAAADRAGGFLADATVDGPRPAAAVPLAERPGTVIGGRYKLLQQIGEGGFGVVFMAEQERPVRRTVALKVIKLGMDTREVVARFEAERQALALMDHPNIAKVLDAGSTEAGRPYFVMELVRGLPVTEYADKHRLSPADRVALLAQVCRAVQHAHGKGVIHRDLKPSNVLVATGDGDKPVPKVIDFGIAKATQSKLTDRTLFTQFRQLIGTPQYMSPEQADSEGLDVDTRSDVYSLGVVLYELLVGVTPLDAKQLRSAAFEAMRRMIRDQDPAKPSTKLNTLGDTLATVATNRSTDAKQLSQQLHGELDWIVMKSLEKDRARRYDTAAALADDLNRYLSGEAVLAGPVSGTYRLRKMAHRHRAALGVGGALAAALLLGMAGTTGGLVQATHQRHLAERRQADADHARADAERDRLAAQALADEFHGQVLVSKGQFNEAVPLLKQAWDRRRRSDGDDATETIVAMSDYAGALSGSGHPDDAKAILADAVAAEQRAGRADTFQFAQLRYLQAVSTSVPMDAIPPLRDAARILRTVAPDNPYRGNILYMLGSCLAAVGRPADAEVVLRENLAWDRSRPGADPTAVPNSLTLLNQVLKREGKPAEPATTGPTTRP